MQQRKIGKKLKKYHLEYRHLTVLVMMLIIFQLVLFSIQRSSFRTFLDQTQEWYQINSAERLANSNATTLELLIENLMSKTKISQEESFRIKKSFNIVLTQQLLEQNIHDVCILFYDGKKTISIDNGTDLYNYIRKKSKITPNNNSHKEALELFNNHKEIIENEKIQSYKTKNSEIDLLVPLAPHGELIGVFYMKNIPDFSSFSNEVLTSYNFIVIVYSSMMLLGLLTMYYISSYTMKERDSAQQKMFDEQEKHIKQKIEHNKESSFTKRIYHTHHKAEKIMGFIKTDLRELSVENIEEIKNRTTKYANFVSRAIYDMKWYDSPIQTIRGNIFKTNINKTIQFLIDNIFLRVSSELTQVNFKLELDENMPVIHINEFIIWEILEPLIQNSIDHAPERDIDVTIETHYYKNENISEIIISDNGNGIANELLEYNSDGIQIIFEENRTTRQVEERRAGYGCFIAHQLAVKRCAWDLKAENLSQGCRFIITLS